MVAYSHRRIAPDDPLAVPEAVEGVVAVGQDRLSRPHAIPLSSTLGVALVLYLSALGASALIGMRAVVLDAVPFCLAPALLIGFAGRIGIQRRIADVSVAALLIVALGLSLACLSYVCAAADLPLQDGAMVWIDRKLGFDWLQIMLALDRWPRVLLLLDGAYATFTFQLIATVVMFLLAGRTRELDRFFVIFACASVFAEIASILVPTLGPMATLAYDVHFAHLPTLGRNTAEIVVTLREGALKVIDLDSIDGIISFPSLHAAVAVIVPYALRWNKTVFWPVLILDVLMLVSAIPSGNHYLIDVVGGVVVAVLAILCSRPLQAGLESLAVASGVSRPSGSGNR